MIGPLSNTRHAGLLLIRLAVAVAIWFVCSVSVRAIPLSDYHHSLQQAITALDTLWQVDENETTATYSARLSRTIDTVRSMIPKTTMVQSDGGVYSVDNSWFHDELTSLEKSAAAERPQKLLHVLERLKSIEQRILELQEANRGSVDKSQAKQMMGEILNRPEYAPKGKATSALKRLLTDFFRWLEKFLPKRMPLASGQGSSLVRIVQIVVIGLCVAVLVYVLRVFLPYLARARKVKDKSKQEVRVILGEQLAADESAKDLLSEAELLARSGQLRAAIRKAYIALLVELGDRKIISLAQHKTNRDYLRSLRSAPALYASMNGLTEVFERCWYGLAQPTPTDWQEFRSGYQETLKTHT